MQQVVKNMDLRVNGIEYLRVGLRRGLVQGHPSGPLEAVIKDDPFGHFPLTDDFKIELREESGDWKPVSLTYLLTILQTFQD